MALSIGSFQVEEELISTLQSALSKEQEKVDLLQHQIEELIIKHSQDIITKDKTISQLNNELDAKANVITLLSQQLCQIRIKLKEAIEAGVKESQVCVCPHCFVHRKSLRRNTSTSPEVQVTPLLKQKYKSMVSLPATESSSISSVELMTSTGIHAIPTPPFSPHPPTSSVSHHHSIVRRASTPRRLSLPSRKHQTENLSTDNTHRQRHSTRLPGTLPSELHQLFHPMKDEINTIREPPVVLPPISPYHSINTEKQDSFQDGQIAQGSLMDGGGTNIASSPSTPPSFGTPHAQHQHLILAKAQGLSSAPSTLQMLHYGTRNRQTQKQEERDRGSDEITPEGVLMVKENEQKGSGSARWGNTEWTPALD